MADTTTGHPVIVTYNWNTAIPSDTLIVQCSQLRSSFCVSCVWHVDQTLSIVLCLSKENKEKLTMKWLPAHCRSPYIYPAVIT